MNRDLLKKHDPNKDYNVFWELLLSSLTPSFQGFHDGRYQTEKESIYLETVDITLEFGKYDFNPEGNRGNPTGNFGFCRAVSGAFWSISLYVSD